MFTNNFITWFRAIVDPSARCKRALVDTSGNSFDPSASNGYFSDMYAYNTWNGNYRTDYKGIGLIFGTGDTAPTVNDYKLAGDLIAGLTVTITRSVESEDEYSRMTMNCTITNNTSSEVTIREAGFVGNLSYNVGSSKTTKYGLLWRMVLETPVTIPVGSVGQVFLNLDMHLPYGA